MEVIKFLDQFKLTFCDVSDQIVHAVLFKTFSRKKLAENLIYLITNLKERVLTQIKSFLET
jgi:hypothetical protein